MAEATMSDSNANIEFVFDASPLERAIARATVTGILGTNLPAVGEQPAGPDCCSNVDGSHWSDCDCSCHFEYRGE
jgi:hypothetical protein